MYMKVYKKCIWVSRKNRWMWSRRKKWKAWKRRNAGGEVPIGARQTAPYFTVTVSVIQFYYLTFFHSAARFCPPFPLLLFALALENCIV